MIWISPDREETKKVGERDDHLKQINGENLQE